MSLTATIAVIVIGLLISSLSILLIYAIKNRKKLKTKVLGEIPTAHILIHFRGENFKLLENLQEQTWDTAKFSLVKQERVKSNQNSSSSLPSVGYPRKQHNSSLTYPKSNLSLQSWSNNSINLETLPNSIENSGGQVQNTNITSQNLENIPEETEISEKTSTTCQGAHVCQELQPNVNKKTLAQVNSYIPNILNQNQMTLLHKNLLASLFKSYSHEAGHNLSDQSSNCSVSVSAIHPKFDAGVFFESQFPGYEANPVSGTFKSFETPDLDPELPKSISKSKTSTNQTNISSILEYVDGTNFQEGTCPIDLESLILGTNLEDQNLSPKEGVKIQHLVGLENLSSVSDSE